MSRAPGRYFADRDRVYQAGLIRPAPLRPVVMQGFQLCTINPRLRDPRLAANAIAEALNASLDQHVMEMHNVYRF